MYNTFQINNLQDYSDLYLLTDVLLLADIVDNFRDILFNLYNLASLHTWTLPGFAWQAALKHMKNYSRLSNRKFMYEFIEKGVRRGIAQITHRYAQSTPSSNTHSNATQLIYLDANNLYGHAMSQTLPSRNFRWLSQTEIDTYTTSSILNLSDTSPTGMIYGVDLNCRMHLHDNHKDFPLAPDHLTVYL